MADVLVLGGTRFSGAHLVRRLLDAGERVTVFTRGRAAPACGPLEDLGPAASRLERLVGERDPAVGAGLSTLRDAVDAGQGWDAVIDLSGFVPRVVRASAELVRAAAGRYVFISSVSVYPVAAEGAPDEESAVVEPPAAGVEEVTGETYGGLKVACERVVREVFGAGATVVRPGLIVGPGDYTDRFTWWTRRLMPRPVGRGRALVPVAGAEVPTQWIDGRDLAAFVDRLWRDGTGGTFHAIGEPTGFGAFVRGVRAAVRGDAELVEANEAWLTERGVRAWQDIPCWVGSAGASMQSASTARARSVGLVTRGLEETCRDLAAWDRARGLPALAAGLSAEREDGLLAAWAAR
jgi:2'-hydroxyisoflavone reductase